MMLSDTPHSTNRHHSTECISSSAMKQPTVRQISSKRSPLCGSPFVSRPPRNVAQFFLDDQIFNPSLFVGHATQSHNTVPSTMKFAASILLAAIASAAAFAPSNKNAVVQRTHSVEMGLWGEPNRKDGESDMSQALPFAPRPKLLDGTLAGDVGFE